MLDHVAQLGSQFFQLPRRIHHDLQQVAWAKAAELQPPVAHIREMLYSYVQMGNSFLNSIRRALGEEFATCLCDQVNVLA
jgi:hypothetical protein